MARRRDYGGPGRQQPGRQPGRRPRKEGAVHDAIKRAINEEIKGVPSGEILLHLRAIGLDTETAKTVYSHVREQVAKTRRRVMWGTMLAGAGILVIALGLVTLMTVAWTDTWYVWWILTSLLAVIGLLLLVVGQTRLRRMQDPQAEGARKPSPPTGRR
jgi:UPF0716 family protein affecting phage T7 exclusion